MSETEQTKTKRFLKERLQRDYYTFKGCVNEWQNVYDLLRRVAEAGESSSALLIGSRGCGKTTLISSVLHKILSTDQTFIENAIVVCLNGFIHTDDSLALKSATTQLNLDNGKVFGSFAENLSFLLESLQVGCDRSNKRRKSKSVIFILEEFDLFCNHHNQMLLYNLFDASQSSKTPVCVIGITCRLDVIELLEKRVKSRFSHRQIFLFTQNPNFNAYLQLFGDLLKLPNDTDNKDNDSSCTDYMETDLASNFNQIIEFYTLRNPFKGSNYTFSKKYIHLWNTHIDQLINDNSVQKIIQNLYDFDTNQSFLKSFLFKLISMLKPNQNNRDGFLKLENVQNCYKEYEIDDKILLLCELSVLEISIMIAIKHHTEIYNNGPFNFEIIYNRFMKFSKTCTMLQGIDRSIILKAYEHLCNLEFIVPITNSNNHNLSKYQKEFQMHKLLLTIKQINKSISKYEMLPTEIIQWAQSSLI